MALDRWSLHPLAEDDLLAALGFKGNAARPTRCYADTAWLDLVGQLQDLLRQRLKHKPICIEANPSSNLVVGGYASYTELPYRILVDSELALSINTDDPGLFMTSLPGEFQMMYDDWAGGMNHRAILSWLNDRCFDARQSSFLSAQTPVGEDALALLATPEQRDRRFAYQPP